MSDPDRDQADVSLPGFTTVGKMRGVKLNIGAGRTPIEGFTNLDRQTGTEAYPLPQYEDGSVDEIRASHILEHFAFEEVPKVLTEWVRVLKPGGRIRIAVPNFDWIADHRDDPKFAYYMMGGQTDENDFHRSLFTSAQLEKLMADVGLAEVKPWTSDNTDCASLPVSLNREGVKAEAEAATSQKAPAGKTTITIPQNQVKITAVLSVPRLGFNDAWGCIVDALLPWKIPIRRWTGAYWGQCMQNMLEQCVEDDLDMILTLDYDTLFTAKHFDQLLGAMCRNPKIDAIAALQAHRGKDTPLMAKEGTKFATVTEGQPLQVDSAHFGMTLLRVPALRKTEKPWMMSQPDKLGSWGAERMDADVWFWHQWKKAGNTLFIAPDVRVGHLATMVREFTREMKFQVITVSEWRERETEKTKLSKESP